MKTLINRPKNKKTKKKIYRLKLKEGNYNASTMLKGIWYDWFY